MALLDATNDPVNDYLRWRLLVAISGNLVMAEDPVKGKFYAERGYACAMQLGYTMGQAISLSEQGRCAMVMGDFPNATRCLQTALSLFVGSERQGTRKHFKARSFLAEVHFLKTEYAESRAVLEMTLADINPRAPPSLTSIFAELNIAGIDILTGVDVDLVQRALNTIEKQISEFVAPIAHVFHDMILAVLKLHRGEIVVAKNLFQKTYHELLGRANDGSIFCSGQLADYGNGMHDTWCCLKWSSVLLGLGRKIKDKLAQAQAFRCLGKIFLVEGDPDTALTLFGIALENLTFMDVHRWRADCMMYIAQIYQSRGNIDQAVELWMEARPLFQRTAQRKDVTLVDAKLHNLSVG
jgi:tetratricopeptide (TPR) repeat protein